MLAIAPTLFCVVFRTFHSFAVTRLNLIFVHIRAAAVSQQRPPPCAALFGLMGRCAEWPDSPCGSSGGLGGGWGGGRDTNTTWSARPPLSAPSHCQHIPTPGPARRGDVRSDVQGSSNHISPPVFAEGLKEYFCKFGEVKECMVMRDPLTKRSR